jgi:pyruvate,water dikinase
VTSDDIDAPTLGERRALHFAALRAATEPDVAPQTPDDLHIRVRMPADQRAMFDELVAEARYGLRQRDDNVGVNLNWPAGLVRRAALEAGRRLCDKALLASPDHAIELSSDEIGPLLASGTGLTDNELAARAARRNHVEASGLPDVLGVPETPHRWQPVVRGRAISALADEPASAGATTPRPAARSASATRRSAMAGRRWRLA